MSLPVEKSALALRSPDYLTFVRTLPCCICSKLQVKQRGRTQAHHTEPRGRGSGSDALCVPVCQAHHPQSNKIFIVLLREHDLTVEQVIAETQVAFCIAENYDLKLFMDRDDPFESLLMEAGIACKIDDSHRVTRGTAKTKSKKLSKFRPLSKPLNRFDGQRFLEQPKS